MLKLNNEALHLLTREVVRSPDRTVEASDLQTSRQLLHPCDDAVAESGFACTAAQGWGHLHEQLEFGNNYMLDLLHSSARTLEQNWQVLNDVESRFCLRIQCQMIWTHPKLHQSTVCKAKQFTGAMLLASAAAAMRP